MLWLRGYVAAVFVVVAVVVYSQAMAQAFSRGTSDESEQVPSKN